MRRPPKIRCQLGLAKHSHACSAIKWACERLGVEVLPPPTSLTSEAILNSWTTANREGHPPHVIFLDCRANKRLDVESVARYELQNNKIWRSKDGLSTLLMLYFLRATNVIMTKKYMETSLHSNLNMNREYEKIVFESFNCYLSLLLEC